MDNNTDNLYLEIYKKLTNKKFRAGPLPPEHAKELILKKIKLKVELKEPVKLFQFWGGCKNSNLEEDKAELCEEATLDNLYKLNSEVKKVYLQGLKIFIFPGDKRIEFSNYIPKRKTEVYIQSLKLLASKKKYNNLFTVIPISLLHKKYSEVFNKKFNLIKTRLSKKIESHPNFPRLVRNSKKNINTESLNSSEVESLCIKSARDYIIFRVAEEESLVFREFDDCIRSSFIRYSPFYKDYIENIDNTKPNINCSLIFFTGCKGNVTQPWQAVGKIENGKVIFYSQDRLK